MLKPVWLSVALLSAVCMVSACGGGGGSGDSQPGGNPGTGLPGTGTPGTGNPGTGNPGTGNPGTGGGTDGGVGNSWLTFSPASISHTVSERSFSEAISVVATSSKTIAEPVNVAIVDTEGVVDPQMTEVIQLEATRYEARLSVLPTLKPGKYRGAFTVKLCLDDPQTCQRPYPGSPWLVPYEIEVTPWQKPRAEHKLLVSDVGVALSAMPGFSRLSHSLRVSDNLGQASRWQARSDQAWLSVTASGSAGQELQIQADPAALVTNAISYATVTVSSTDAGVAAAQPVVVALWKGGEASRLLASGHGVTTPYLQLLADPIRPHVYAHNGYGTVDVFNVYTGARVGALSAPGARLSKMLASPDGAYLYVWDLPGRQVLVFDVRAGQLTATWPLTPLKAGEFLEQEIDLVYARPNGTGLVVSTTGQIFRASDGKQLAGAVAEPGRWWPYFSAQLQSSYLAVSPDGMRVFSTDSRRKSPNTPFYWDMDYSEENGGSLSLSRPFTAPLSQQRLDQAVGLVVSRDGKQVLMPESNGISAWSTQDLSRLGALPRRQGTGATLVLAADGRMVIDSGDNGQFDLLAADGQLIRSMAPFLPVAGSKPDESTIIRSWSPRLAVSSDGAVVIQRAYHQVGRETTFLLTFMPIAP